MRQHFVYITTNLINRRQYVGDHSTNTCDDRYIGSGNIMRNAINKYGKENFKREILEFFPTKKEAFEAQEKYINEYNTLSPNGYNISPKGGLTVKGCHSEETKKLIGKKRKGQKMPASAIETIRKANTGRIKTQKELENLSKSLKGKKFTEDHRNNLSKSLIENESHKGNRNPMYGKKHTEEAKEKNRIAHIGKKSNGAKSGTSRLGKKRGSYKTKKSLFTCIS